MSARHSAHPPIRLAQFGLVNTYLVPESDGLTLIDAGLPGLERRLPPLIARLGRPLRRVAITHAHADHVGSLDALVAAHPGLEVLLGEHDAPGLAALGVQSAPTRLLRAGDRVRSLVVLDTPGHSPGHVAYLDERDGTLYSGDTFVNVPGLHVASVLSAVFPLPTLGTHDPAGTTASARALLAVPARFLATGHGPVVRDPGPAMRRAVAQAEEGRAPSRLTAQVAAFVGRLTGMTTGGAVAAKAGLAGRGG
ncbi:MBL fold metallo-hydrolase [Deinococcus aquaedulcis]|uniref:MBL fold metallo-hydrolase n=1 Tax=Deinococcus aquaedulcis TaxID=2840455 RepID=UPI001C835FB5|nr:MBL fold metallo-hydrolase [Deinococcus aquaedulcis]